MLFARTPVLIPAAMAAAVLGAATLGVAQGPLARLNVAETELSAAQARNINQLARMLSVLQLFGRDPPPALLVSPRDAKDAVRAAILVRAMTPELQRRARAYAAQAGEMTRQRRLAAVQSEALFEQESARAEAAPEPSSGTDVLLSPGRRDAPLTAPDALLRPSPGRMTHGFGAALVDGSRSNGLTFVTAGGSRVVAPGAGVVQYVGPVKGWGVIVIFRLAGGYHLVLAGLDRTSLAVGQSVAAGDVAGWMPGARQSAPELYLEVREQGSPVDPARWLGVTRP